MVVDGEERQLGVCWDTGKDSDPGIGVLRRGKAENKDARHGRLLVAVVPEKASLCEMKWQ